MVDLPFWGAAALALSVASAAVAENPPVITKPDWASKPRGEAYYRLFPEAARRAGLAGRATIECAVTETGGVVDCKVVSETPPGYGFGEATVRLAPDFRMKPMTVDGQPVGGATVRLTVRWTYPGKLVTKAYVRSMPWAAAPTRAEVDAANKTGGVGEAWLDCAFAGEGRLKNCRISSETRAGLGRAAQALASRFQAETPPTGDVRVLVPFRFGGEPGGAKLEFTSGPDGAAFLEAYPKAARDAGVVEGRVVLACTVAAGGGLADCAAAEETPPGLGFGPAALGLAGQFRVNPWTSDGEPVDGRSIRVPIRYEDMSAAAGAGD